MTLRIGIVGLPNVGKSTLFYVLSGKDVRIGNYAFCTIEPNTALVAIPDERLDRLSDVSKSKKKIYGNLEVFDIAGLVKGASEGAGLGNQFLGNITQVDLIVHLVRCFEDKEVIHVQNRINPVEDLQIIQEELINWDIKALEKENRKNKTINLDIALEALRSGTSLFDFLKTEFPKKMEFIAVFNRLALITDKPSLVAANIQNKKKDQNFVDALRTFAESKNLSFTVLNSFLPMLVTELGLENAKQEAGEENLEFLSLDNFIRSTYTASGNISFFTTGPEETRSWNIKKNTKAVDASGVIHTDFVQKFIKAEVWSYESFIAEQLPRVEGKEYVVKDGDVIIFKLRT